MMNESVAKSGYRGYIGSRPYNSENTAQHVQNLVIRDYCQRNHMPFLLSATEYHMPGAFIMLEEVMREINQIDGVVLYSFSMLPNSQKRRGGFIKRILNAGASLHGALENLAITDKTSWQQLEDILAVAKIVKDQRFFSL